MLDVRRKGKIDLQEGFVTKEHVSTLLTAEEKLAYFSRRAQKSHIRDQQSRM